MLEVSQILLALLLKLFLSNTYYQYPNNLCTCDKNKLINKDGEVMYMSVIKKKKNYVKRVNVVFNRLI